MNVRYYLEEQEKLGAARVFSCLQYVKTPTRVNQRTEG